jgi:hypothetical protein
MRELSCNINGSGHQVGLGILNLKILSILMFKYMNFKNFVSTIF